MVKAIYRVGSYPDDPRYEFFSCVPDVTDILRSTVPWKEQMKTRSWKKKCIKDIWVPPLAVGRVRSFNDYPCIGLWPAFSERAVAALREFLEPNGELLPLIYPGGNYFAYNLTTVADILDCEKSDVKWERGMETYSASILHRYAFDFLNVPDLSIFVIPQAPDHLLVTDAFVTRAREAGLNGMKFIKIWPIPEGITWYDWNRQEEARLAAEKAKRGEVVADEEYLNRHSVVIHLGLQGNRGKGSKVEREAIAAMMDGLDALLATDNPDEIPAGALAGHEYLKGECALFLRCPDCDALVRKLRPWFKALAWPDFAVDARRGVYTDSEAPEERIAMDALRK